MSRISISSASVTAPMGMVVSTAEVNSNIQEPSRSRIIDRRDIRSSRRRAALRSGKYSLEVRGLKPCVEMRTKRMERGASLITSATSERKLKQTNITKH